MMNKVVTKINVPEKASVRIFWEDSAENYTQQRRKQVESYFRGKYGVKKVNVVFKPTRINELTGEVEMDVSENIMDDNYQKKLFKSWLDLTNHSVEWERLLALNKKVQGKLELDEDIDYRHRSWKIKQIEFDNFLSFGEGNLVDYSKLNGVAVIASDPPNFGGKTILSLDLILYLLFNTTTKTSKSIEVFNRFSNKDKVRVKGNLIIDDEEYVIERVLTRKKTKKGDWTVKTELSFSKIMADGSVIVLDGEQRRETDDLIKKSIGSYDDFMSTIISTASNLEDLIETKPTERGKILAKFIGLEVLGKKEVIAKTMYSSWNKSLKMNTYNIQGLKSEISELEVKLKENINNVGLYERELTLMDGELSLLISEKEGYFGEKIIIDEELIKIKPDDIREMISNVEKKKEKSLTLLEGHKNRVNEIGDVSFIIDEYTEVVEEEKNLSIKIITNQSEISKDEKTIKDLENSEFCPVCKREMEGINNKTEVSGLNIGIATMVGEVSKLRDMLSGVEERKSKMLINKGLETELEKIEITMSRVEIDNEKWDIEIQGYNNRIEEYNKNLTSIEKNKEVESKIINVNLRITQKSFDRDGKIRLISTFKKEIEGGELKIEEKKEIINIIGREEEVDNVFRVYIQMLGKNGVGKIVMNSVIPSINNELERLLSDTTEFNVVLDMSDKKEVEFFMDDRITGVRKTLSSGSGFEKTLASLALRCVLTKISCLPKPNIIVLDEVLGKVSNENLDRVGEFFDKVKEYFPIVMLITHNDLVKDWSDKVLMITKKNNISSVGGL